MSNFWFRLAIREAIVVATEYVDSSKITSEQKKALEELIVSGQKALDAFSS